MRRVLVPLDGTALSASIIPDACALAGPGGEILLVHVLDSDHPVWHDNGTTAAGCRARSAAERYLERVAATIDREAFTVHTEILTDRDTPRAVDGIATSLGVNMIVCATHGRGVGGRLAWGSVTRRLLAHSPVPVAVRHLEPDQERARETGASRKILVPLDGSALAETVLPLTKTLAQEWNAPLNLARVVPDLVTSHSTPEGMLVFRPEDDLGQMDRAETYLERIALDLPHVEKVSVFTGAVPTALVYAVEEWGITDVILATHGRTGWSRMIVGSVTEALMRQLHCLLIIVPALSIAAAHRSKSGTPAALEA